MAEITAAAVKALREKIWSADDGLQESSHRIQR